MDTQPIVRTPTAPIPIQGKADPHIGEEAYLHGTHTPMKLKNE